MQPRRYEAIIFDKDGTLLDVEKTWTQAIAAGLIQATQDTDTRGTLAQIMGFDLGQLCLLPDAAIMTLSNAQIAELAHPLVDGWAFINSVNERVLHTITPMHDADSTITALLDLGIALAVVTNDGEQSTRQQLAVLGWEGRFDPIYGYDSGHGWKPEPEVVIAAMRALGSDPEVTLMVGDSAPDLIAARSAGITSVLVGDHPHNAHLADVCIENLSDLLTLL